MVGTLTSSPAIAAFCAGQTQSQTPTLDSNPVDSKP